MPLSRASVSASAPTSASSSKRRDRQDVSSQQSKEEFYQLHAYLCKGLAHPTRLLIIDELRDGPRSVSELVQRLGLRQSSAANAGDGGAVFTVTLPLAAGNRVEPVLGRMIDPEGLGGPPPRSAGSWARPRKLEG